MIELKDIRKSYAMGEGSLDILKGVSLTIEDGDFVAIMGPSGSGKSTLMNILGLLDVPTGGSYQLNGREVAHMDEDDLSVVRREEIGFIFQQFNLLPRLTALENVALPLLYSKRAPGKGQAPDLLERVGLGTRMDHRPNELSGGQQQRVAIARSLVNRPRMILADEPTGNLDSVSEKEVMRALRELNEAGITVVMVTHEEEIGEQAKRLIRMRDGVVQSDTRREEFRRPELAVAETSGLAAPPPSSPLDFLDYFKQGFKTLAANKVRTCLSMLGILIGVAAVVAMLALGHGAQQAIQDQLSALGSNLLMVKPGAVRVAGITQDSTVANRLSYLDVAALKARISNIKEISAQVSGRMQVTAVSRNWNTTIQATSANWDEMHNSEPVLGRYFTEEENAKRSRVAIIGDTVRREVFGDRAPIGEMIKINDVIFQVIGVLPVKGANGFRDQDDVVNIPVLTGMFRLFGRDHIEMIEVQADSAQSVPAVQQALSETLSTLHKIPLSQQDEAFQINNMADIQAAMQQSGETMSLLLSSIAAISLLVGGIGIMNIMLVSVTERTKEIGLRKAIGARRKDILSQFLSESVVVSAVGGLIGILLGWAITLVLSAVAGWATSVSVESVALAFLFSALIGVIFGVYPARKAAALNPIDALRYE